MGKSGPRELLAFRNVATMVPTLYVVFFRSVGMLVAVGLRNVFLDFDMIWKVPGVFKSRTKQIEKEAGMKQQQWRSFSVVSWGAPLFGSSVRFFVYFSVFVC